MYITCTLISRALRFRWICPRRSCGSGRSLYFSSVASSWCAFSCALLAWPPEWWPCNYPILTNSQAELLMPTIVVQAIDNVILNLYEIILGYCSLCYLFPESTAVFVFFLFKMLLKIACSIAVLNIYSDQHNYLASMVSFNEESNSLGPDSVDEIELANHNLL
nr:uncharacterized protein LOC108075554 isoform X2 [Drosophila kikkawai]